MNAWKFAAAFLLTCCSSAPALALKGGATAEFTECLGLQVDQMAALASCTALSTAVKAGVKKLNHALELPSKQAYRPVSVVSASESNESSSGDWLFAMLVQVAPKGKCTKDDGENM